MKRIRLFMFIALLAGFVNFGLTGCLPLREFAVVGDRNEPAAFDGIIDVLEDQKYVNILFVHGMGGYACPDKDQCDPFPIIDNIQSYFPGHQLVEPEYYQLNEGSGELETLYLQRTSSQDGQSVINYYVLDWEHTVKEKKKILKEDACDENAKYRLKIMNGFKQGMMNHNLADVALYMGTYQKAMQLPIRKAIEQITLNDPDGKFANVIVTFSLGSSMVFDTINIMDKDSSEETRNSARQFRDNTRLFFMLANQIPLIELSRVKSDGIEQIDLDSTTYTEILDFVGNTSSAIDKSTKKKPWVIAISDPNDLLSYPIFKSLRQKKPDTFVSVFSSVQRTAYWIPFVGKIANPYKAHIGYGIDKKTLSLIIDGYDVKRD
jgi:hypothetical protein